MGGLPTRFATADYLGSPRPSSVHFYLALASLD